MSYTRRTHGFEAYTVRGGHQNMEWATILIRGWQMRASQDPSDDRIYQVGEILVHSSYGSWAYQWSNLGKPFKQWLSECNDPEYVAAKFLGVRARKFNGEESLRDCRRRLIQDRRHGDLTESEAREIWNWLEENELELETSEHDFVRNLLIASEHVTPTKGALRFLQEPWERVVKTLDRDFCNFWSKLMQPFQEALRNELNDQKVAA